LKGIPGVRAETLDEQVESARGYVQTARDTEAMGGSAFGSPRYAQSVEILRIAGVDANSITAAVRAPASRAQGSRALPAEAKDNTLMGISADGRKLTAAACAAEHVDPLAYLTTPGAVLTAEGRSVLRMLQGMPHAKAEALKIDVAAVEAAARRQGIEPAAGVAATVEMHEQLERDKRILAGLPDTAPAQNAPQSAQNPVDDLLEKDRANARRFGLSL
jgi:hypothetical protein